MVSAKMAGAAAAAWILATELLSMSQPFLAPYAAVFLIEVTISRSLRSAAEQIATVTAGVLVAALVVCIVGQPSVALAVSVFVGALVGRWSKFGTSGIWIPVTALLMVTYGSASDPVALVDRIVELAVGAAVGVAVNATRGGVGVLGRGIPPEGRRLDPVPPFHALGDDVRVAGADFVRALADVVEGRCDARRTQADVVDRVAAAEETSAVLVHTVVASGQGSAGATMSAGRLVGPATAALRALT